MRNLYFVPLIAILLSSCSAKEPVFEKFGGFAQGTTYSIVFEAGRKIRAVRLQHDVDSILDDFDMSLSMYKDSSLLSRINRNETDVADFWFTDAFNKSRAAYDLTGGAFDITVGPLVRAWGFGPDAHRNFSEAKRDSLMQLVGMNRIRLNGNRLVKDDPRISLDFNAIAQGYSVDVICDHLRSLGMKNFLVEIGGEVRAVGDKTGQGWKVGVDRPEDNNFSPGASLQAIVSLANKALATSGNYRKFYVENGIKYSHTIDPKTGYPAKNTLLSASIIADDCSTADAVATACMVMGRDKAIEFIKSNTRFQAYFVYSDEAGGFATWISDNLRDHITEE